MFSANWWSHTTQVVTQLSLLFCLSYSSVSLTYLLFHPGLETKISCKDFLSVDISSKTFRHFLQAVPCAPVGKLEKSSCNQSCVDVNQRLICATVGIHWITQCPLPPRAPLLSSISAALLISENIPSSFECTETLGAKIRFLVPQNSSNSTGILKLHCRK